MSTQTVVWPVRIVAETTDYNGHRMRISRVFNGAGEDVKAKAHRILMARKNAYKWYGCGITLIWPTSSGEYIFEPEGLLPFNTADWAKAKAEQAKAQNV